MNAPPSTPSSEALAELHEPAYRWALICCGMDEDEAQETMQTVYLEILTGRACYQGRSTLKTWLFAVVRNTALRLLAGRVRARERADRLACLVPPAPATDPALDEAADGQTRRSVLSALQHLPQQQRLIIELVYYHELSVSEAAEVMGVTAGSASQHFHRAKRALAEVLWPLKEVLGP